MVSLLIALCLLRRWRLLALAGAVAVIFGGMSTGRVVADDRYATPPADQESDLLILYQSNEQSSQPPAPVQSPFDTPSAPVAAPAASSAPPATTPPIATLARPDVLAAGNPLRAEAAGVALAEAHEDAAAVETLIEYQAERKPTVAPESAEAKPLATRSGVGAAAKETIVPASKESPIATTEEPARRLAPPSREWDDVALGAGKSTTSRSRSNSIAELLNSQSGLFKKAGTGLALVVGLFVLCVWLFKPAKRRASGVLPTEAFEVLGRAPLVGQSVAHLLRLGNKLVLVSITPEGAQTLAEVTDPLEVGRLAGLCAGTKSNSPTAEFQQVLAQLSREPARGFLGREVTNNRRKA